MEKPLITNSKGSDRSNKAGGTLMNKHIVRDVPRPWNSLRFGIGSFLSLIVGFRSCPVGMDHSRKQAQNC
jgi:hypothetical protein